MKGSKKKPAKINKPHWDIVFCKMKKLCTEIEMYFGVKMDIDNLDYRWVEDRIEYYEKENRLLTHQEMKQANLYWKKYSGKRIG